MLQVRYHEDTLCEVGCCSPSPQLSKCSDPMSKVPTAGLSALVEMLGKRSCPGSLRSFSLKGSRLFKQRGEPRHPQENPTGKRPSKRTSLKGIKGSCEAQPVYNHVEWDDSYRRNLVYMKCYQHVWKDNFPLRVDSFHCKAPVPSAAFCLSPTVSFEAGFSLKTLQNFMKGSSTSHFSLIDL